MQKTILIGLRVTDLEKSLAFYTALGYKALGVVPFDDGSQLTMLKLPDEPSVSLELVHRPADGPVDVGTGFDHLAIQYDVLADILESLTAAGLEPGPMELPGGPDGPKTAWITDPDGYRIELVEWPPGQEDGLTEAAFA
ncbi:VOC family protein [Flindersiella endophytica]